MKQATIKTGQHKTGQHENRAAYGLPCCIGGPGAESDLLQVRMSND
jgi:hypothetical protein